MKIHKLSQKLISFIILYLIYLSSVSILFCQNPDTQVVDKALELEKTDPLSALDILNKAEKDNPSSFLIVFHIGRINYEHADELTAIYQKKTSKTDSRQLDIESASNEYFYQTAFRELTIAHQIEPKQPDPLFILGKITFNFQKYKESINYYKKYLELVPNSPEAVFEQGVAYFSLNDIANAEKNFVKGTKINPANGENYYNLGIIKQNQKKYDKAKTYFIQAANIFDRQQKKKELIDSLVYAGICAIDEGKADEGIKYYNSAINIDPKNSAGYFDLAAYYSKKEYYDRVLQIYKAYLNEKTDDINVYQRIVSLLKKTKKFQAGITILSGFEKKEPKNPYILFHLGQLYYLNNDKENAEKYFHKCIDTAGRQSSFTLYSVRYLNEIKNKKTNTKSK
jgi:tetratricopeptide (TPR) repeat protein